MYWFVVPAIRHPGLVATAWTVEYIGDIMIAIPARPKTMRWHTTFAQIMGYAMIILAVLFALDLSGGYAVTELILVVMMSILGLLTYRDGKRYVFYQAPFIYLSHFTILIAAIALIQK
ncbi:MAG: hypothetical protein WDN27_02505 [Candidatus Saccharibacteria bacterium]